MVILISGESCCGKTTMAQKLLEKYHFTYLSIDHLKMGLIRGCSYCDFKADDSDDLITEKLWGIVCGIIKTNIENDQNIIIEGCYIKENWREYFDEKYQQFIFGFSLIFSRNYIKNNYENGIISHLSEIEYKEFDDYLKLDYFVERNKKRLERCKNAKADYFIIDKNYKNDIQKAYAWVDLQYHNHKELILINANR